MGSESLRTRENFNQNWHFNVSQNIEQEPSDAEEESFDDSGWRTLNLPHDWGIEGPFSLQLDGTTGKLPWSQIGWYRKTFELLKEDRGKRIFLDIDGAMANAQIYLNGEKVGERPNGYSSFRVELTDAVSFGQPNVLAVRLDTLHWGSRWYPGAGLYRNVWLIKTSPIHVGQWGVSVSTPELTDERGTARIETTVENQSLKAVQATVETHLYFYGTEAQLGKKIKESPPIVIQIPAGESRMSTQEIVVKQPVLWDITDPQRYLARTLVRVEGKVVDTYDQPFGFRTLEFTPYNGFFLNGKRLAIQGVCMHHDLGPLGGAFNTRAFERQMEIMKEMGVNAIRTSHNQPAPEVLEVCDRIGMLVQVESFDCWKKGKKENDYSILFEQWHEQDLIDIVRLSRNHPSVFMWNIGNEVREKKEPSGIELAEKLTAIIKRYDTSRPVTLGSNSTVPATNGLQKKLDVFGFNYGLQGYSKFHHHSDNTNQPYHGSETSSCVSSRGEYFFPVWDDFKNKKSGGSPFGVGRLKKEPLTAPKYITGANFQMSSYDVGAPPWGCTPDYQFMTLDQNPAALGEFVWTGFDYLGEPTPYNRDLSNLLNFSDNPQQLAKMEKQLAELGKIKPPSRSSYFGIVDLCGFKKDRFYIYQARWRPNLPMAHILPHWNWPERIGKITPVHVYTSGDEAELFLNETSLGRKKMGEFEYRLKWNDVVYEPGELHVVVYKEGKLWAEDRVQTTEKPTQIGFEVDRVKIRSDGVDLAFITVRIEDAMGQLAPRTLSLLDFEISGPGKILAIGNGDPTNHESFQAKQHKTFNGLCLVIIQSVKGLPGKITLSAAGSGFKKSQCVIQSTRQRNE